MNEQQKEWMLLLADGWRRVDIARKYNIKPRTMESYLGKLLKKFNCSTIAQLVAVSLRKELIK